VRLRLRSASVFFTALVFKTASARDRWGSKPSNRWSPCILMSSQLKRPSSSRAVVGTLVIASLFACACGATPDETGDGSGSSPIGAGGGSLAGASGFANGSAGSVSSGGAIGVAGSFGTSGSPPTGGSFGAGGAVGVGGSVGIGGSAGFGGSAGSFAGASGFGSVGGVGGQGTGGQAHGGAGGMGGSGGGAVTFTELYTQYFNNQQFASNCAGGACHNPGTQKGIDFSTQAKGYASVKADLSRVISQISSGGMPRARPKWTNAELALVKAWQAEGAPNN
jgi:hypothetical protein